MKLLAFAVRDSAVEAFLPPFYVRHVGEAVRSFESVVRDSSHQFGKSPSYYTLYRVGSFEDTSGMFSVEEPVRIASALELLALDAPTAGSE